MEMNDMVGMKTNNPYEIRYCCPNCNDEGFHLYYNTMKCVYHCVKCGAKGRRKPEKVYTEEKFQEMMQILRGEKPVESAEKVALLPNAYPVQHGSMAMRYMLNRGIPQTKVSAIGCLMSVEPAFDFRVIIPVFDEEYQVSYYQARALMKSMQPKYLNPVMPKQGAMFYNMSKTYPLWQDHLYVVEGIFKALQLWRIDCPAVAIFGKEITKEQVTRLHQLTSKVTILLDPDAFKFAIQMGDALRVMKPWHWVNVLQPPKAPDDMRPEELEEFLRRNDALFPDS